MRPSYNEIFTKMIDLWASRSPCLKRQIGAFVIKDNRIITMGYNGPLPNVEHCKVCKRMQSPKGSSIYSSECLAVHAEENALHFASREGIAVKGAELWINEVPCRLCFSSATQSGISKIIVTKKINRNDLIVTSGLPIYSIDRDNQYNIAIVI